MGLFLNSFGLRLPDAVQASFPSRKAPPLSLCHPRPFSEWFYFHCLFSRSFFRDSSGGRATQHTNCICFFCCVLRRKVILLNFIQNLIFMASWANGLCTQVRFVYQNYSHIWQILTNRNCSFPPYLFLQLLMYVFLTFDALRLLHLTRTGLIGKTGLPVARSLP